MKAKIIGLIFVIALSCLACPTFAMGAEVTDRNITLAIESKLLSDNLVSAQSVDVSTQKGIVTLAGKEDNLLAKERAGEIVRTIRGVRAVVNNIQVKPVKDLSDQDLKKRVEMTLFKDPVTESYEIDVQAKDGFVSLTGRVDSWQEKELSTKVVKGVKGVRGVQNNILVIYPQQRPITEVVPEVRKRLRWDAWVNDQWIDVVFKDGKVELSGKVGSVMEKSRAYQDAWVGGVTEVDDRNLVVDPGLKEKMRREFKQTFVSDSQIRQAVLDAFLYDPRVLSFRPQVDVDQGTVTLTGTVSNLKAKRAAEADARATLGVWRVRNFLKVRPEKPVPDETIKKEVAQAMIWDPIVDRYDLTVSVEDAEVDLYGTVNSLYEKTLAGYLAAGVKGVEAVHNFLVVRWPGVTKSDRAIREDIEDELWWSPFVDADQVMVTVSDGVATLTGTVDSHLERGAAVDNAYSGGASRVINLLKIRKGALGLAR